VRPCCMAGAVEQGAPRKVTIPHPLVRSCHITVQARPSGERTGMEANQALSEPREVQQIFVRAPSEDGRKVSFTSRPACRTVSAWNRES
jgi:hypothetical protein